MKGWMKSGGEGAWFAAIVFAVAAGVASWSFAADQPAEQASAQAVAGEFGVSAGLSDVVRQIKGALLGRSVEDAARDPRSLIGMTVGIAKYTTSAGDWFGVPVFESTHSGDVKITGVIGVFDSTEKAKGEATAYAEKQSCDRDNNKGAVVLTVKDKHVAFRADGYTRETYYFFATPEVKKKFFVEIAAPPCREPLIGNPNQREP